VNWESGGWSWPSISRGDTTASDTNHATDTMRALVPLLLTAGGLGAVRMLATPAPSHSSPALVIRTGKSGGIDPDLLLASWRLGRRLLLLSPAHPLRGSSAHVSQLACAVRRSNMINRVMALVRSGYSVCAREVRERVPWRVAVSTVALIVVAAVAFMLSLDSGSSVKVTHDQARTYAGILAQVIPVFVLALYVESAAQWSTLLASLGQQRQTHLKLSADVQSNQADIQRVRDEINRIGREYVPVETVTSNERSL